MLLITFDEAGSNDATACCRELPGPASLNPGNTGPGGGDVGAVLLSPFIAPGTVSQTAYNHYSMLGSMEDLFGLPHLGYAQLPGESDFGSDVYTHYTPPSPPAPPPRAAPPAPHAAPVTRLTTAAIASSVSTRARVTLRFGATASGGSSVRSYDVQSRDLSARRAGWRTLTATPPHTSVTISGTPGHSYVFRVAATDSSGETGAFALATTVIPSGVRPAGGHYSATWKTIKRRGAWLHHAIESSARGSTFTLHYVGATVTLIGETSRAGGRLEVTLDGHSRTLHLHSPALHTRRVLVSVAARAGRHHLELTVLSGTVALEGYGIASRTG